MSKENKMPRRKDPRSLRKVALSDIAEQIMNVCRKQGKSYIFIKYCTNKTTSSEKDACLFDILDFLPGSVLEDLIINVLQKFWEEYEAILQEDSEDVPKRAVTILEQCIGFMSVFNSLLRPQMKTFILQFLPEEILPRLRELKGVMRPVLLRGLPTLYLLTHLSIPQICTDEILLTAAKFCPRIRHLNVSSSAVSDIGLQALCGTLVCDAWKVSGCRVIQGVDIHSCEKVTVDGVVTLIQRLPLLEFVGYERLGDALQNEALNSAGKIFPLKYFEQTVTDLELYIPSVQSLAAAAKLCPNTECAVVCLNDEHMKYLSEFRNLKTVSMKFLDSPGEVFCNFLEVSGSEITTLELEMLSPDDPMKTDKSRSVLTFFQLQTVAKCCPSLKTLKIRGIFDFHGRDEDIKKIGKNLVKLEVFHIDMPSSVVSETFVLSVLRSCQNLRHVSLHGNMQHFLNDDVMKTLLKQNPLKKLEILSIKEPKGNEMVPLTVGSARLFAEICPSLKHVGMQCWSVSSEEFQMLDNVAKKENWDITLVRHDASSQSLFDFMGALW